MEIKRVLVKQSRFLGNCVCGVSVGMYRITLVGLQNLIQQFSIVYRLILVINSNVPGWQVEPTTEEDDSLAAYCEWTFILNKYYTCNYFNTEYFRIIIDFKLGKNISVFVHSVFLASYQVIHRRYLDSRYSLDTQASRQYPLAEILGPDHYQWVRPDDIHIQ